MPNGGTNNIFRIWWLTFILVFLCLCVLEIIETYEKWISSPVIVTFATTQTPIWKIPFPAVTICPEVKSRRKVYNFTREYISFNNNNGFVNDEKRKKEFDYISLVCPTILGWSYYPDYNFTADEKAIDFITKVAPSVEEVILSYQWQDKVFEDFLPTLASEGLCYTYNMLSLADIYTNNTRIYETRESDPKPSHWTLENGYEKNAEIETFPVRTTRSGITGGLQIVLMVPDEDLDSLCGDAIHGFKVILQHPAEIPQAGEQYFRIPLDQDVVTAVRPRMMTTSDKLKQYDPEDRQCLFGNEKPLHFFKIYNQQNCLLECLTNYTFEKCGCVAFYMPRNKSTPICEFKANWCINAAAAEFLSGEVSSRMKNENKKTYRKHSLQLLPENDETVDRDGCNCLPACTSLEFETETCQSPWDWPKAFVIMNYSREISTSNHFSRLRIFFKDMQFITSERNELYGITDFLANCGGLLGLFTGFSFISLVEILYYLTLRLFCNLRIHGKRHWSGTTKATN